MVDIKTPQYKNPDKSHTKPFFRYETYSICMSPTEKYPEMVEICRTPKTGKALLGKKYVNHFFAIKSINTYKAEKMIRKQFSNTVSVLETEGYDVDTLVDTVNNDDFFNF
jgi:hypothetical protein